MIEALWSVDFTSNVGDWGAGVAVLETERVLGGDGQYFYVGSYRIREGKAEARIRVTHYAGPPNSVFGQAKQFDLELSGTPARNGFVMTGHVVGNPSLQIGMRLTRRAELP
jgi:hypothetical protein